MTRVLGFKKSTAPPEMPTTALDELPTLGGLGFGRGLNALSNPTNLSRVSKAALKIGNADRPTNVWYRMNGQSAYWYQYNTMYFFRSEISALSTMEVRYLQELFRNPLEFRPKFIRKCADCGYQSNTIIKECPVCKKHRLAPPDASQKKYFVRPNGKSFIDDANDNHQPLMAVLKSYMGSQFLNNQGYLNCIARDVYDDETGKIVKSYPVEFLAYDPRFVRYLYDESGKPGALYAFTRDDRNTLINLNEPESEEDVVSREGKVLYPASWQIGSNYGATGKYWLYTDEEMYQSQLFRPSITYGVPIWFDIEDDLLAYHFIEKHNLKKYKYGYVRKIIILPGFNDEDAENLIKGVQDVLSQDDNSCPIVCTPPNVNGLAPMEAQTLELGTESSQDLLAVKEDIRNRLCAHGGLPNLWMGDVEASGGMNNESQQITIMDRYLQGSYDEIDRACKFIMSWFPKITDWELVITRPSKAYSEMKRLTDRAQLAQLMKSLGFEVYFESGDLWFSEEPVDQIQRRQQEEMMIAQQQAQARGILPGDGYGPPEKGTARREDPEIGDTEDEIDQAKREADDSKEV